MATWRCFSVLGLLALAACTAGEAESVGGSSDEVRTAADNGAGAGPARFDVNPCENPAAFAREHGLNLIIARERVTMGTDRDDLIVGTEGDDVIRAGKGDDVVCAGGGEDEVHGEEGNDWIDGGSDNDKLFGDDGNDILHGRGGGDEIHGGAGDDQVFGDILDDKLWGDAGDDLIVGGHGTDFIDGGAGNDYMRGDTGNDTFDGGPGEDIVSFITAMPPGQPDLEGRPATPYDGMRIDFTNECLGSPDGKKHEGCANGDGGNEPLDGVEIVVGSPYGDQFVSNGRAVKFLGGWGADTCDGAPCGRALPAEAGGKVFVTLETAQARDVGLVVVGSSGNDDLEIVQQADAFKVSSPKGTALFAGPGCTTDGAGVTCTPRHVLRWIAAYMGDGNDTVRLAEAAKARQSRRFPADMTAHVSGGKGNDRLEGGAEEDILFSGVTGEDHLFGNDGDDALLSESRKWPAREGCTAAEKKTDPRCTEDKPKAAQYTDGADVLVAGAGDDQLVADYPCGGHSFSGGGGKDVAGFARSGRFDIHAQLAGPASTKTKFWGRAFNPQLCGVESATKLAEDDMEILEAADGNDELWGNDKPNTVWGREGNDVIHGLGGDDNLMGLMGDDSEFQ